MCTHVCKDQLSQASECRVPQGGHGRDCGGFLLPSRPRAPARGSCMESDQAPARVAAWGRRAASGGTCSWGPPEARLRNILFLPKMPRFGQGPNGWIVLKSRNCPVYPKNLLEKHILFCLIHSAR